MKNAYKKIVFITLILLIFFKVNAQTPGYKLSGRIIDVKNETGISGAAITLEGTYLWAISEKDGYFILPGVQKGEYKLYVSYLGYVPGVTTLMVENDITHIHIGLEENSLLIEEVVVTAQAKKSELNTTWVIGSDALKHMQVSNVTDVGALLPGGKTINPNLTSDYTFSLREGGTQSLIGYGTGVKKISDTQTSNDNNAFGTVVEVDGVRISNNGSFNMLNGVSTRNIAMENIDYIEIITGIPSLEYGDLNSGLVKIHTRKGATPWNVLMSVNPRTQQTSLSKGFDLGNDKGVVNFSAEWSKATQKLTSPYTSYTRRGFSAGYSNTFRRTLKFDIGVTGNFGGMNSEDDPDAYTGEYTKVRDNVLRANTSLVWLLNKSWITNLKLDASVNYNDNRSHEHKYYSYASEQPDIRATEEGYFLAGKLPYTFFAENIIDSKELDYAASLKYEWNTRWNNVSNRLKAGIQWKATGNVGDGEDYLSTALTPYRHITRSYASYPFMHNVSLYAEENISIPVGNTVVEVMGGIRFEKVLVSGIDYKNLNSLSPRFNARWHLTKNVSIRGGWGITEKLPSYYVLYPEVNYRDIQTFGFSYNDNESSYVFYSQPYTLLHNENLKWQRNQNAEIGVDIQVAGIKMAITGYSNRTKLPYKYTSAYTPFSYNVLQLPEDFSTPTNPQIKVDSQTGMVYIRGDQNDYWTEMDVKVTDNTFVDATLSDNGPDIVRRGMEVNIDFPEITPIRTQIRVDGTYGYTKTLDNSLSAYYQRGWSHTSEANKSYQYVGIYTNGTGRARSMSAINGKITKSMDANITAITHIPRARLIISCRVEMALLRRMQNLSEYNGQEYAFNVSEDSNTPTGGSIYDGNSYTAIRPVSYMDTNGTIHPFTEAEANSPEFSNLIIRTSNAYTFAKDGYDPYFSANLSITKEIGDYVTLSFFANNFTKSRKHVTSYATGVSAVFVPDFYYGLTCRLKF